MDLFTFWLLSIVEDDPIPYEINHIVFVINQDNSITMGGCEQKPNLNNMFDYYPLEAQYFYLKNLSYLQIKNLIDESFSNEELKFQFKKRKIYCSYFDNIEFLFCV